MSRESVTWEPHVCVAKYSPDQVRWARSRTGHLRHEGDELAVLFPSGPEEGIVHADGNSLTDGGALNLARLIAGHPDGIPVAGGTALVGVGADSSANKASPAPYAMLSPVIGEAPHTTFYQSVDRGYPKVVLPRIVRFQATMGEHEANFGWQEWGVAVSRSLVALSGSRLDQVAEEAVLMNRKAVNLGVKRAGRSWVFSCSLRCG